MLQSLFKWGVCELKYSTAIFDLDGTIADSKKGIIKAFELGLEHFGIKENDREKLNLVVGPPLIYSYKTYYNMSDNDAQKAVEIFRSYYRTEGILLTEIYDGMAKTLDTLYKNKIRLAVATAKPEPFALSILERFDLKKYFELIVAASFDCSFNEKDQILEYTLDKLNSKENTIMIGDRDTDMKAAKKCGIDSAYAMYGCGSEEEAKECAPTYLFNSPEELIGIIL
ncbi:MAG: HAD family hydrolase [Ruminococcaceae bacterium]|nr:HAD family hydrolase [Oscillospiraceae bacterium]